MDDWGTSIVPSGAMRSSMTSVPAGNQRVLGSRSDGIDEARQRRGRERGLRAEARTRASCRPRAGRRPRGASRTTRQTSVSPPIRCTFTFQTRGPSSSSSCRAGARAVQRLVHADGRAQLVRQPDVAQQLVGRERLLDVEQPGLVERAEARLVLGPVVAAVGVDGERDAGARERAARRRAPARASQPGATLIFTRR